MGPSPRLKSAKRLILSEALVEAASASSQMDFIREVKSAVVSCLMSRIGSIPIRGLNPELR